MVLLVSYKHFRSSKASRPVLSHDPSFKENIFQLRKRDAFLRLVVRWHASLYLVLRAVAVGPQKCTIRQRVKGTTTAPQMSDVVGGLWRLQETTDYGLREVCSDSCLRGRVTDLSVVLREYFIISGLVLKISI